jgi:molybdopterin synthase catalytic subunit
MIVIADRPIVPGPLIDRMASKHASAGAIVSMIGQVRAGSEKGKVLGLGIQHYPGVTERDIQSEAETARRRWSLNDLLVVHRVGLLRPGETIVIVAAAAPHRREAFDATDFMMDHLKTRAFFWKKEITQQFEQWIEPREADFSDAARWTVKE